MDLIMRRLDMIPTPIAFDNMEYGGTASPNYFYFKVTNGNHFELKGAQRDKGAYVYQHSGAISPVTTYDVTMPTIISVKQNDVVKTQLIGLTVSGTLSNTPKIACAIFKTSADAFGFIQRNPGVSNPITLSLGNIGNYEHIATSTGDYDLNAIRLYFYGSKTSIGSPHVTFEFRMYVNGIRRI